MVMVPDDYKTFISTLDSEIKAANIPMSRIDDAVTRILTAKFAAGLFTQPYTNRSYTPNVGSEAHRMVARQAERESLVLLKNKGVLPLSKTGSYTLVVGGDHADNLGYQLAGRERYHYDGNDALASYSASWTLIFGETELRRHEHAGKLQRGCWNRCRRGNALCRRQGR